MDVIFGRKNVVIECGKTKSGEWICKFQRTSETPTPEMLKTGDWKKLIDNSPCILKFETINGLNQVIISLKELKEMMIEEFIKENDA